MAIANSLLKLAPLVRRFFATRYASGIIALRWPLTALLAALVAICFALATRLHFPSGVPSIWPPSHNIPRYYAQELLFAYGKKMDRVQLTIVLGQSPSDHGSLSEPYETGELVLTPGARIPTLCCAVHACVVAVHACVS